MGTLNRVLVPFFIAALPVAAMIAYIGYYYRVKPPVPEAGTVAAAAFGSAEWAVFRGDAAFCGAAEGTLPDRLELAWRFETGDAVKSTPTSAGGLVFISSMDGQLYGVDLKTGVERWRFKADDALEASPLFADGTVFVGSDTGTFYAVDAKSGQQKWAYQSNGKILGSANTFVEAGSGKRRVVFGSYDNYLYCLEAADGALVWKHEAQNYINGSPAIAEGAAVFGSCDGNLYIVPLGEPDKTRMVDIETYMAASPAIEGGVVYAGNYEGLFLAASMAGGEVLWRFRQESVPFVASPAVTAERVLFGGRDNTLYCLNRADGAKAWTFAATEAIDSSPVVCGNRVVFGADNGRLYVVDLADGREVFSYTLGKAVSSGPAIVDSTVLVGCDDGAVYAFRAAPSNP